jgi:hypothetical protein
VKRQLTLKSILLAVPIGITLSTPAAANLITNAGFESGLSNWTTADQPMSEGAFVLQTGTTSPDGLFTVPPPPEGSTAAMTGAQGPGSHVLYQDFLLPAAGPGFVLGFSLFVGNRADAFFTPDHLDYGTPDLNQHARVDILDPSADPFSVAPGDIVRTLFRTNPGDPLISGYNNYRFDITSLMQTHAGQTLRLRFAEVDNLNTFQFGVDQVSIEAVPEPGTWALTATVLLGLAIRRLR